MTWTLPRTTPRWPRCRRSCAHPRCRRPPRWPESQEAEEGPPAAAPGKAAGSRPGAGLPPMHVHGHMLCSRCQIPSLAAPCLNKQETVPQQVVGGLRPLQRPLAGHPSPLWRSRRSCGCHHPSAPSALRVRDCVHHPFLPQGCHACNVGSGDTTHHDVVVDPSLKSECCVRK